MVTLYNDPVFNNMWYPRTQTGTLHSQRAGTCKTVSYSLSWEFCFWICHLWKGSIPVWTSSSLNPLVRALGTPHSVLIITLWKGWYQKSYPMGAAGPDSQRPLTSKVFPSRITKPPKNNRQSNSRVKFPGQIRGNLTKMLLQCGLSSRNCIKLELIKFLLYKVRDHCVSLQQF